MDRLTLAVIKGQFDPLWYQCNDGAPMRGKNAESAYPLLKEIYGLEP